MQETRKEIDIMVLFFPSQKQNTREHDIYMSEIEDEETIKKHTCKIKLQAHQAWDIHYSVPTS